MEKRLDEILQECTARIEVPKTRGYGTGFFIAPTVLVTCKHVIRADIGSSALVYPYGSDQFLNAKVQYLFDEGIDLAILHVRSPKKTAYKCVYISHRIEPRDNCFAFGYTEPQQGYPKGDPVTLECEGIASGDLHKVIKLKKGQVLQGLSGSPLLNQRTGAVCGIIRVTRDPRGDLGGEAIPTSIIFSELATLKLKELHDGFHEKNRDWINLLDFDSDPFLSDWSYLDLQQSKLSAYFKTLVFLIFTSIKWFIFGLRAPKAFPVEIVQKLLQYTIKGKLGQEVNRQRKEFEERLNLEVDFEASGQARVINQLISHSAVLISVMDILVDDEQSLASQSRLTWASEMIYEQQSLLESLKAIEGNSYPGLEKMKKNISFLAKPKSQDLYFRSDRILGKIVSQHTGVSLLWSHTLRSLLENFTDVLVKRPRIGIDLFEVLFRTYKKHASLQSHPNLQKEENEVERINAILHELNISIGENPRLKMLSKVKILLESVAGEPIVGGKYRAWNRKGVYHFSRKCKLYPERARPHEMKLILLYETSGEAKQQHKPCKTCTKAEKSNASAEYFIGEEYPSE